MRTVPTWDEYFMAIAETVATRSKDPHTQVGAIIVNKDKHIIGAGYNGFAPGEEETEELWQRPTKYEHVIHAEENAIQNAPTNDTHGASVYCTLYPCYDCARNIVASGIKKVVYKHDELRGKSYITEKVQALFEKYKIEVVKVWQK